MPLDVEVGSFIKPVGAAPVSQFVPVAFTPGAIMLWGDRVTADTLLSAEFVMGGGFATGPADQYSQGATKIDTPPFSGLDGSRMSNGSCFQWSPTGAANPPFAEASLTSFDAGPSGFTINWTANDGSAAIIYYLALGGTDLQDAVADSFQQIGGAGAQAVTGLGFQPDAIIMLNCALSTFDVSNAGAGFNVGFCDDALNQRATHLSTNMVNPALNIRSQVSGITTRWADAGGGREGTITSMDPDGFTIDWDVGGLAHAFGFLALRGALFHVGDDDKPVAPGQVSETGVGFQPQALFAISYCDGTAFQRSIGFPLLTMGAADGTTEGTNWIGLNRAAGTLDAFQAADRTKILQMLEFPPYALPPDGEADLFSFDVDGFTLDWPVADATARKFLYFAIGPGIPVPPPVGSGLPPSSATQIPDVVHIKEPRAVAY